MFGMLGNIYKSAMAGRIMITASSWIKDKLQDYLCNYANGLTSENLNNSILKKVEDSQFLQEQPETCAEMGGCCSRMIGLADAYFDAHPDCKPNLGPFIKNLKASMDAHPEAYGAWLMSHDIKLETLQECEMKMIEQWEDIPEEARQNALALITGNPNATLPNSQPEFQEDPTIEVPTESSDKAYVDFSDASPRSRLLQIATAPLQAAYKTGEKTGEKVSDRLQQMKDVLGMAVEGHSYGGAQTGMQFGD